MSFWELLLNFLFQRLLRLSASIGLSLATTSSTVLQLQKAPSSHALEAPNSAS
jgi:hypothetical protein